VNSDLVIIPVTVTDGKSRAVADLRHHFGDTLGTDMVV
jgi:hypothetical protein